MQQIVVISLDVYVWSNPLSEDNATFPLWNIAFFFLEFDK